MRSIYTIQLAQHRLVPQGYELLDITVKSGLKPFAPTWGLVQGIKKGLITEREYTAHYVEMMRESYIKHREHWSRLVIGDKPAVLACYCNYNEFCHRVILAEILQNFNCEIKGEITKDGVKPIQFYATDFIKKPREKQAKQKLEALLSALEKGEIYLEDLDLELRQKLEQILKEDPPLTKFK